MIPCEKCITLAICKSKTSDLSALSFNIFLYKCSIINDYVYKPKSVRSVYIDRFIKICKYFNGG